MASSPARRSRRRVVSPVAPGSSRTKSVARDDNWLDEDKLRRLHLRRWSDHANVVSGVSCVVPGSCVCMLYTRKKEGKRQVRSKSYLPGTWVVRSCCCRRGSLRADGRTPASSSVRTPAWVPASFLRPAIRRVRELSWRVETFLRLAGLRVLLCTGVLLAPPLSVLRPPLPRRSDAWVYI